MSDTKELNKVGHDMNKLDLPDICDEYKDKFMEMAFDKAKEALVAGEVPIGWVFVTNEREVIAESRNEVNLTRNATRHA